MLLHVGRGATVDDVVQARRVQAKLFHPDVNPGSGSAERMGLINRACDLLCDHIRAGGEILGVPARARARMPRPVKPAPQPTVFNVRFDEEVGLPIKAPDRHARLEIDTQDAIQGGARPVRFVRREPGRCQFCAGLGAAPGSPKKICTDCDGAAPVSCPGCEGRGWISLAPGSCIHCGGTGAALVEHTIRLNLPPGIREVRRTMVRGWGDLEEDGSAGNLWIDLVPTVTAMRSENWRFAYFGHNWPRPEGRVDGDWLAISNTPLPDEEMRELGFWRDVATAEWVRQAPADHLPAILELIHQRQFFVPQPSFGAGSASA